MRPNPFVNSLPGDIAPIAGDDFVVVPTGLMSLPSGSRQHGTVGYHHTGTLGLMGVLQSNELWASSPMALNDSREVRHGHDVMIRTWRDMDKSQFDPKHVAVLDSLLEERLAEVVLTRTFILSVTSRRDH